MTSIGESAFEGCSKLTSLTIGNSVTSIGKNAFFLCRGLTSITIPNSVTSIGEETFFNCSGLTSITIPNSVTSIGDGAFNGCSGLTSIAVDERNLNYDSRNGCNAIIETSSNTLIAGCMNTVIPESVTSIGDAAFYCCFDLTSIDIPNSVTSIGEYAFVNCEGLTSITIPNSVTSIGESAFYGCSSLTSATIGNSVTSIGVWAFYDCSGLNSVTIGSGVTSIGESAFYYCRGLTDVYCIAKDVPETDMYAFDRTPIESATLHVPESAIGDYKASAPWTYFGSIVALTDEDAIISIKVDEDKAEPSRYDLQGRRLSNSTKGINIIRENDGTVKKIMMQ